MPDRPHWSGHGSGECGTANCPTGEADDTHPIFWPRFGHGTSLGCLGHPLPQCLASQRGGEPCAGLQRLFPAQRSLGAAAGPSQCCRPRLGTEQSQCRRGLLRLARGCSPMCF
ncbi:unnamed protein product, partial [Cladocopium goreaui]